MVELNIELSGSDSYAARFGESIANLGDIDNDGYEGKYTKKPPWISFSLSSGVSW